METSAQQEQHQQQQQQQQQKPPGQGLYQCTTCRRTYTRVDHLARHVRSHLQERPFQCQACGKAFGRPDLLKRHAASHNDGRSGSIRRRQQPSQAWRVSQACKPCATAKLKCDDEKPCARCQEKGIPCEPEKRQEERQARTDASQQSSLPMTSPAPSLADTQPQPGPDIAAVGIAPVDPAGKLPTPDTMANSHVSPQFDMPDVPTFDFAEHEISGFPRAVMTPLLSNDPRPYALPTWPDLNIGFGTGGLMDFTSDGGFDFDDTDLGFIDQLCNYPQGIDMHQPMQIPRHVPEAVGLGRPQRHVALGAEAYKRSSFSVWHPAQQDHGGAEVENLSVPSAVDGSPQTQIVITERCLGENLNRAARDELLSMVLRTCKPERLHFVFKAFPTPEFLDDLLQSFFFHHYHKVDSFIHIPSFKPNQQAPEFLGAIAAAGAALTNIKSVHKLGFALQDAVRTTIPGRCEDSNAITRELWLLQAFMTELEVGIWSGIKRKMEIAESQSQTVYTMLRRAGRFRKLNPMSSAPLPQDTGETLHRKWREWVEQESFKRLAFHAFLVDARVSMALLTSPIISYAELAIPLPDSQDLWNAEDAEQWKSLYLGRARPQQRQQLSLIHFLREPIEIPEYYDIHFSRLIILHGIWGMIWQHSQLLFAVNKPGHPGHANASIALRHQDLLQTLQHFRINLSGSHESPCPQTSLLLELLPMYLHSSLEEIQLFAGREELDDARRVLPSLQRWVESSESRQAIWHAGQVLRATRNFRPGQLREFVTIAIYHASLVMWTYSIISQAMDGACSAPKITTGLAAQIPVSLDGPDSGAIQRFITIGKGIPSITRMHHGGDAAASGVVPLSDQEAVIGVVLETLRGNFPCDLEEQAPPPLVENLIQLLRDLGKAAGTVGS